MTSTFGQSFQAPHLGGSGAGPEAGLLLVLGPEPVVLAPLALVAQDLVGLRHLLELLLRLRVTLRKEWRRNFKQVQSSTAVVQYLQNLESGFRIRNSMDPHYLSCCIRIRIQVYKVHFCCAFGLP